MSNVTPFLMFQGNAEEAMNYYISLIEESEITSITRYGTNEAGEEGSVMQATFFLFINRHTSRTLRHGQQMLSK
jgi:predicted 3-demethylubiquinone-9 3-methyltransferase (glyoxalase superfamily)